MIVTTKVSKIEFGTHSNGLIMSYLRFEDNKFLNEQGCYGISIPVGEHLKDGKLPFVSGSSIELEFDAKGNLSRYKITTEDETLFTELPTHCSSCGQELTKHSHKGELENISCENIMNCRALAISPIYRLARTCNSFLPSESFYNFVKQYPDAPLTHLSDFKHFLKSDPNTQGREAAWIDKKAWVIEKSIWNFLKEPKMSTATFWYIGFGLKDIHSDPHEVLAFPHGNPAGSWHEVISSNIDRVEQLLKFFDHFQIKEYVSKAH